MSLFKISAYKRILYFIHFLEIQKSRKALKTLDSTIGRVFFYGKIIDLISDCCYNGSTRQWWYIASLLCSCRTDNIIHRMELLLYDRYSPYHIMNPYKSISMNASKQSFSYRKRSTSWNIKKILENISGRNGWTPDCHKKNLQEEESQIPDEKSSHFRMEGRGAVEPPAEIV